MTTDTMVILRVVTPGKTVEEISMNEGQTIAVGRDPKNELALDDPSVSRIHACFTANKQGVVLADLSSRNGTFLNGERVNSFKELVSGDIVDIGLTKITVQIKSLPKVNVSEKARLMTTELRRLSAIVMIASIIDYPNLWQIFSTEEADRLAKDWHKRAEKIVENLGGHINQSGDRSIVVVWTGIDANVQALNALMAIKEIRLMCAQFSEENALVESEFGALDCSIVLSAGSILSDPRTGENISDLLGDPIQTAFKLEDAISKLGQRIIIHESAANLINNQISLRKIIGMRIRDGEDPTSIFAPV